MQLFAERAAAEKLTDAGIPVMAVEDADEGIAGEAVGLLVSDARKDAVIKRLKVHGPSVIYVAPSAIGLADIPSWQVETEALHRATRRDKAARKPSMTLLAEARRCDLSVPQGVFGKLHSTFAAMAVGAGAPEAFIGHSALGLVSGVIAGRFCGSPWSGWKEHAMLNAVLVGAPSSNKTPALNAVVGFIRQAQAAGIREHAQRHKLAAEVESGDDKPNKRKKAPIPPPPRCLISDASIEAAVAVASGSDRGLALVTDEFASWLHSHTRYRQGGGSDRSRWLEAWVGAPTVIDRVKSELPAVVPCWGVSIVGSVQPDVIGQLYSGSVDDGLEARMLPVFPDLPPLSATRPPAADTRLWEQVCQQILRWRYEATPCQTLMMSDDARELFSRWRYELLQGERRTGSACGWTGKLPGHLIRIALVMTVIDAAAEGVEPTEIGIDAVRRAGRFVEFLAAHRRRIRLESGEPPLDRIVREAARFIVATRAERLDTFEVRRGLIPGIRTEATLRAVLSELDAAGWLDPLTGPMRRDLPLPASVRVHPGVKDFWAPPTTSH